MNRSTLLSLLCLGSLLAQPTVVHSGLAERHLAPADEQPALMQQLFAAIRADDLMEVERVIEDGVDLRVYDDEGNMLPYALSPRLGTPLHIAVCLGRVAIAQVLHNVGASIDIGCFQKCPEWHYPSRIRVLPRILRRGYEYLRSGIKMKWPDPVQTASPLHGAVGHGSLQSVEWLLEQPEEDVDKLSYSNITALHLAVHGNHFDIVQLLCRRGANPFVQEAMKGWTPRDIALYLTKNEEISTILEEYEACFTESSGSEESSETN